MIKKISFAVALISTQAFASVDFNCTANVDGFLDRSSFSQMNLNLDKNVVTGSILTDSGLVNIGTNKYYNELQATVDATTSDSPKVTISYYLGHDIQELSFNLVEGKNAGHFYEFVDCLGETNKTVTVECVRLR
jgi:hypothetical protein